MYLNNQMRHERLSNRKPGRSYDIVPIELTSKPEIDLGNGQCLTKVENIINEPTVNINAERLLKQIEEEMPELLVASDTTEICGMRISEIYEKMEKEKIEWEIRKSQLEMSFL